MSTFAVPLRIQEKFLMLQKSWCSLNTVEEPGACSFSCGRKEKLECSFYSSVDVEMTSDDLFIPNGQ